MPARPSLTLLLLTRDRAFRADFARAGRPPDVTASARADLPDLPGVVDAALAVGTPPGKTAYVLATDFWVQTVGMAVNRVAGLEPAEVAQALNFEAEVLSGLPALEAVVAVTPLPAVGGERRFHLLQLRASDRDGIGLVLQSRGSRLGGLLHPGGLPRDNTPVRVELWPDAVVGVRRTADGLDVRVSNTDPMTGRWPTDFNDWPAPELVVAPGIAPPPTAADPVRLEKQELLTEWFAGWAAVLASRRPRTPVVRPVPRATPAFLKLLYSATVSAVFITGSTAHYKIEQVQLAEYKQRTTVAVAKSKQFADVQAAGQARQKDATEAAAESARVEKLTAVVKTHQERYAQLLEVLAARKPAEVMVKRIESDNGEPKLIGVALRPELVDEYVRAIAPDARKLGWEVRPPHKTADKKAEDGGPWSFTVAFRSGPESTPPPAPPPPAPKTNTPAPAPKGPAK